jgi:hypothetical protein
LPTTLGVDSQTLIRLVILRKKRNITEYTGDLIPESAVAEVAAAAGELVQNGGDLADTEKWRVVGAFDNR